jgi:hypothetical protein
MSSIQQLFEKTIDKRSQTIQCRITSFYYEDTLHKYQWSRGIRRGFAAVRLLGLLVRVSRFMDVCLFLMLGVVR